MEAPCGHAAAGCWALSAPAIAAAYHPPTPAPPLVEALCNSECNGALMQLCVYAAATALGSPLVSAAKGVVCRMYARHLMALGRLPPLNSIPVCCAQASTCSHAAFASLPSRGLPTGSFPRPPFDTALGQTQPAANVQPRVAPVQKQAMLVTPGYWLACCGRSQLFARAAVLRLPNQGAGFGTLCAATQRHPPNAHCFRGLSLVFVPQCIVGCRRPRKPLADLGGEHRVWFPMYAVACTEVALLCQHQMPVWFNSVPVMIEALPGRLSRPLGVAGSTVHCGAPVPGGASLAAAAHALPCPSGLVVHHAR